MKTTPLNYYDWLQPRFFEKRHSRKRWLLERLDQLDQKMQRLPKGSLDKQTRLWEEQFALKEEYVRILDFENIFRG